MPIRLKRSAVADKAPQTTDLDLGELAVNTHDGRLFTKKDDGAEAIVEFSKVGHDHDGIYEPADASILKAANIGSTVQAHDVDIATLAASQAEMEAGTEAALRSMSPLLVRQAIAANAGAGGLTLLSTGSTAGSTFELTVSGYAYHQILVYDLDPLGNYKTPTAQVQKGTGGSASNLPFLYSRADGGAITTGSLDYTIELGLSQANEPLEGILELFGCAGGPVVLKWMFYVYNSSEKLSFGTAIHPGAPTSVDVFRFYYPGDSIAGGQYSHYAG
ncbi:hypothetical protein [Oricola sp.]|uniref:hypothetical protein n=1 Tax=Oricola sp. TaxID=1979950 RepID=UPI002600BDC8|nr:hypothetical protein [Oricola sp.]MCI5078692.1 hypothetical protein [Oricola sp.]